MQQNEKEPLLLKVQEVAKILRIQRPKVYILIKEECLQGIKIGYDWRVTKKSVEKMIGEAIPIEFFEG